MGYLENILSKYKKVDLSPYIWDIIKLKTILKERAWWCYIEILDSWSRAKWTAIHLASDVDYMISLKSWCNENKGWLKSIYDGLYKKLNNTYWNIRKQNVSFRMNLNWLKVDVTPARKYSWNTNYHNIYVSKLDSWRQTNIQKHINDISESWRIDEIKLLKIWRELNNLDFSSIYLEYLTLEILKNKSKNNLVDNFWYLIWELSNDSNNPLYQRIIDPSNSTNILSDLLSSSEKEYIINKAKISRSKLNWNDIVW